MFTLEVALKKEVITHQEYQLFIDNFLNLPYCHLWRKSVFQQHFQSAYIERSRYLNFKEKMAEINPVTEALLTAEIDPHFKKSRMKMSNFGIYLKRLVEVSGRELPLFHKILLYSLAPSGNLVERIRQLLQHELNSIFDYTEEPTRLHNFIKTASWSIPCAVLTDDGINVVNVICSIASYYGVGLEVIKAGHSIDNWKHGRHVHTESLGHPMQWSEVVLDEGNILVEDEGRIISRILNCAKEGKWILVTGSALPNWWRKIFKELNEMWQKKEITNSFRLFYDFQGLKMNDLPESFLTNHSLRFFLNEDNMEDMEGFNDAWANIINEDILDHKLLEESTAQNVQPSQDFFLSEMVDSQEKIISQSVLSNYSDYDISISKIEPAQDDDDIDHSLSALEKDVEILKMDSRP